MQDRTGQMQDRTDAVHDSSFMYTNHDLFFKFQYKCGQPIIVKILSKEPGHLDLFSCRGRNIFNVFFNN